MQTKYIFPTVGMLVLLVAALACSLPGMVPPADQLTVPAPGTTPVTEATSGPVPGDGGQVSGGVAAAYRGASFLVADGSLAPGGIETQTVAAVDEQGGAPWDVAPEHLKFTLGNYPVPNQYLPATLYVYPAQEYEAVSPGAAESLKRLRALTSGAGMGIDNQTVPYVPFFNATQVFEAQAQPLSFQNGAGIRTLTQYDQAPMQVNNGELIYHFEGLTSDGKYYIIAIFPVTHPSLAADGNPASAVPAGGVPFNQDDPLSYADAITAKLNSLGPETFTPNLATLDALIQSIKVIAP